MTFSFFWFAIGIATGANACTVIAWWSLRRENRKAASHVDYTVRWNTVDADPPLRGKQPLASRRADQ